MIENCLFLCISDGSSYEKMTSNLFRSLKYFNPSITTACFSNNPIDYCDIYLNLNLFYNKINSEKSYKNLNDFNLGTNDTVGSGKDHVGYSFKIGLISLLPSNIINNYKKIIYLDSDAECVDPLTIDQSIKESKIYAGWCQSIITNNAHIQNRIDKNWFWNGKYFYEWQKFAKYHSISEWKNTNGGLYVIETNYINELKKTFIKWNLAIKNFFNSSVFHNDELVMSLILATEEGYNTPNIINNNICQLNINHYDFEKIRKTKEFYYSPWFCSDDVEIPIKVKGTCVHSPGSKNLFLI